MNLLITVHSKLLPISKMQTVRTEINVKDIMQRRLPIEITVSGVQITIYVSIVDDKHYFINASTLLPQYTTMDTWKREPNTVNLIATLKTTYKTDVYYSLKNLGTWMIAELFINYGNWLGTLNPLLENFGSDIVTNIDDIYGSYKPNNGKFLSLDPTIFIRKDNDGFVNITDLFQMSGCDIRSFNANVKVKKYKTENPDHCRSGNNIVDEFKIKVTYAHPELFKIAIEWLEKNAKTNAIKNFKTRILAFVDGETTIDFQRPIPVFIFEDEPEPDEIEITNNESEVVIENEIGDGEFKENYNEEHHIEEPKAKKKKIDNRPRKTDKKMDHKIQPYCITLTEPIDGKRFKCSECDRLSDKPSKIGDHYKSVHLKMKSVFCPTCGDGFNDNSHLNDHIARIHNPETIIKTPCPHCDKTFNVKHNMEKHILTHFPNQFKCSFEGCDKILSRLDVLQAHENNHYGIKPHICGICKKSFSYYSGLYYHKIIHTEEQNYTCEFCIDKKFNRRSNLIIHLMIHQLSEDEYPFKCNIADCGFSTLRNGNLERHLYNRHSPEGNNRRKKREELTFEALEKFIPDLSLKEHHINFCSNGQEKKYARIDRISIINGVYFFHENDEDQHTHELVSCEIKRMVEVFASLLKCGNTRPIVFMRFNPDKFQIDEETFDTPLNDRIEFYAKLVNDISLQVNDLPMMSVHYLFYSEQEGKPTIFNHEDYPNDFKEIVFSHSSEYVIENSMN